MKPPRTMKPSQAQLRFSIEDAGMIAILERLMATHREKAERYRRNGRLDLAEQEQHKIRSIEAYLPQRLRNE